MVAPESAGAHICNRRTRSAWERSFRLLNPGDGAIRVLISAHPEKSQDDEDDHDESDQVDDTVHWRPPDWMIRKWASDQSTIAGCRSCDTTWISRPTSQRGRSTPSRTAGLPGTQSLAETDPCERPERRNPHQWLARSKVQPRPGRDAVADPDTRQKGRGGSFALPRIFGQGVSSCHSSTWS